jgi:hypothetical protein
VRWASVRFRSHSLPSQCLRMHECFRRLTGELLEDRGGRRYDKLQAKRQDDVKQKLRRHLGGVYLALSEEPQPTRAWRVGSKGERALGQYLESLHDDSRVVVLHDRRIRGSRANIDHIVICRGGIYAIDDKNHTGKVQRIDKGGWFSTDLRLYLGRRDCTELVSGMEKQVAAIEAALGDAVCKSSRSK